MEKKKTFMGIAKLEKAQHPKFLLNVPVECQRMESGVVPCGGTVGTGESGLAVFLPERLPVGEQLRLKLFFSSAAGLTVIHLDAAVAGVDPRKEEDGYQCGLRLLQISPEDEAKMRTLTDEFFEAGTRQKSIRLPHAHLFPHPP